jgi:hypothetical protein
MVDSIMTKDDFLKEEIALVNLLTREQILEAQDLQTEVVEVPEWGGSVMVQGLTGTERDAFEDEAVQTKGKKISVNMRNIRAKLAAKSIVDRKGGERIFTDRDVIALGKKSAAPLDRVFSVAQKLSGISVEDIEELAKNLDSVPSDASGSS